MREQQRCGVQMCQMVLVTGRGAGARVREGQHRESPPQPSLRRLTGNGGCPPFLQRDSLPPSALTDISNWPLWWDKNQ